MFVGESLGTLFFRYLNFAIVIAIAVYIFKRYLLVGIKGEMAAQEAEQESLTLHKDALVAKQDLLKQKKVSQEQLYADLLRKVKAWRGLFEVSLQERERERLSVKDQ
jgi:hypothetical protein